MTHFPRLFLMSLTLGSLTASAGWAQNLEHISIASLARADATAAPVAASGMDTKWTNTYRWSMAALGAATAADVASSLKFSSDGQREANSFLRSGNGLYGSKGAAIEIGMVGASLLMQHYIVKHHPGMRLPFAISNFGLAAFQAWNVHHNVSY